MARKDGLWFRKESQRLKRLVRDYLSAMERDGSVRLTAKSQKLILQSASLLVAHGMAELFGLPDSPTSDDLEDIPF